jgi:hypothetical protein
MRGNRSYLFVGLVIVLAVALQTNGGPLTADEQAFVSKHTSDVVVVTPRRLDDPAVTKVFGVPVYELDITLNQGENGTSDQKQLAARIDDKLAPVSRPGTDEDCPWVLKMLSPDFKLQGDDDAKALQSALDQVFPPVTDDEKKAVAFRHNGNDWTFIRGKFMDNKVLGFVFTTDSAGKVSGVKFSLQIPA